MAHHDVPWYPANNNKRTARVAFLILLGILFLSKQIEWTTSRSYHTDSIGEGGQQSKNKNSESPTTTTTTTTNATSIQTPDSSYIPPSSYSLPIKTLVILIGNLRCGELAWKSLYENLLDWNNNNNNNHSNNTSDFNPHAVDLSLVVGDEVPDVYRNASLFARAKYVFNFPEYGDDWSKALDLIDPSWKVTVAPLLADSSIVLGGARYGNWHGSGAISFWIRWFVSQTLVEQDLLARYDRFVITRTDHFYMCPHDLSRLDPRYLWVPFGQDYGGITDRHLVVSKEHVLSALNVLPGLFEHPEWYPYLNQNSYNPERLLRDRWKQEGIYDRVRRFPRMMFTCGNPTSEDSTRWKAAGEIVDEGVRKKYRKEYLQSEDTCKSDESE